jgi:uncharacterized protein
MSRIYWDAMLFIYWVEENPQFGGRIDAIWKRMQDRRDELVTGALTLGEVLAGAYKRGASRERIQDVREMMESVVSTMIPFSDATAEIFAQVKGTMGVASADAIHFACAASVGTDLFLTNDRKLLGKVIPGIQFIAGLDSNIL